MKRYLLPCLTVLILISLTASHAFADELSDLQQKISDAQAQQTRLQQEQKVIQAQIDAAEATGNTLSGTIKTLEATKAKLSNQLKVTQTQISSANLTIQKLTLTIADKQKEIDIHMEAIEDSLRQLSHYDQNSFLSTFLTEKNMGDFWQDESNLADLEDTLHNQIVALTAAETELNKQKDQKLAKKTELTGLQKELSGQKQTVQETQAAQTQLLALTKSQEVAYQKLLAQKQAEEKQFENLLFQYESQLKVTFNSSNFPAAVHSVLAFPLDKVRVTQQFGKTSDSGRLYSSGTHNGTDFGTPVGTPVKAVRQGVVKAMGNTDEQKGCYSYGRWILLEHDDGLSTIYGHLSSSIVTIGQTVTQGQIIGYSGGAPGAFGSGYSTGPHLHIGLYVTKAVQVSRYSASLNCKNVSIPISPPEGYLDPLAYMPSL